MLRMIYTLLVTLLLVGCGPRYVDYFPFHDDGTPKPKVALLPIQDGIQGCLPWNVSMEINSGIRYHAMCKGNLFLLSENEISCRLEKCGQVDYFGSDFGYTKQFCGSDYIVLAELIEHDTICSDECNSRVSFQKYRWNSLVQMKVRIRVLDIRCNTPKIILQEILTCNYPIPLGKECLDYTACGWGSSQFNSTPCAKAHSQLISNLVCRIETVIRGP